MSKCKGVHMATKKGKNNTKTSVKRELLEWVVVIAVAVVLALFIDLVLIVNAVVPTASMETTIMTGDRVIGNRLAYINDDPQRGDIVIFKYPDHEKELFIKRIIGLPGETVLVIDGKVYIDDSTTPLDEPYVTDIPLGNFGPYQVPEGAYFMMGDNRNNSRDSRFWNQPYVFRDKILGKAFVRYFPNPSKIQ